MLMPGLFAVMGLLLLAGHLARPDVLRSFVQTDTRVALAYLPWVTGESLDPDSRYQRIQRGLLLGSLVAFTLVNLALFALAYSPAGQYWTPGQPWP